MARDPYVQQGVTGSLQRPRTGDALDPIVIKFGGGINSRELAEDLEDRECANGSINFGLDLFSAAFFPRAPFDLVGTAPNGQSINGYAQLQKQDGSLSTLIQAGSALYLWDGTTFTQVATVASGAKLRGAYTANFPLLNKVLITDLALQQVVSTWDGTSFAPLAHNLGAGVNFYAKYCLVRLERAWFANVAAGAATPHLIVASKTSDPTQLTVTNRPSSSLGIGDPFFFVTPDLSPITGFAEFLLNHYVSTLRGSLHFITGTSSQDMAIQEKYPFIGAVGNEAMTYIGNDIAYGRPGRIETIFGTINYGDVETQELSRHIADQIKGVTGWTLVYDPLLYRLYCFPAGVAECWVYHKSITDDWVNRFYRRDGLPIRSSPWSRWQTVHALGFQPSCAWTMFRPGDGILGVYMGDSAGNLYRMEGTGTGDGGSAPITATRRSKLYALPAGEYFDVEGFVNYQQQAGSSSLTLTFEHNGTNIFDEPVTVALGAQATASYFNDGNTYFGDGSYFGAAFNRRVARQRFSPAGAGSRFSVKASISGTQPFAINDIEIRLKARTSA